MIRVSVFNNSRTQRVVKKRFEACVSRVLAGEGIASADIGVVFVGSRRIRLLNRKFLRHDYITDVLSFPLGEGNILEGEIYVNIERARQQARSFGVGVASELSRLVIHGALHLAGHEDSTERKRQAMSRLEDHYLKVCGEGSE